MESGFNLDVPFVSFVGNSNSGKTTLIEQIVRRLKKLDYRVATVKHASHGFDIDKPGKDSYRFREAGSDVTVISSPTQLALVKDMDSEASLSQIIDLVGKTVDIILVEGYKAVAAPKIAVLASETDTRIFPDGRDILATVIASTSAQGIPQFAEGDITNIVDLLVEFITDGRPHKHHLDDWFETLVGQQTRK